MKKRQTKPQEERHCLQCQKLLTGYKLKYCDPICQRKYLWRQSKLRGSHVSACCDAEVSVTVRGTFCKQCKKRTSLATIYAIPTDVIRQQVREHKDKIAKKGYE